MKEQYKVEMDKIKWLRIELTNVCNFNCSYCTQGFMKRKKGAMDVDLAKKIINETSESDLSDTIGLQFMGEALLHPCLGEIIAHAKERGVKLKLVTNGGRLTDEIIDLLLDNDFDSVYVSYFTTDEYSFDIRGSNDKVLTYEEYEHRIKNFLRKKIEKKAKTQISVGLLNTKYCILPGVTSVDDVKTGKKIILSLIEYIDGIYKELGLQPKEHELERIKKTNDFPDQWTYSITDDICVVFIEVGLWGNQFLIKNGVRVKPNKKGFCPNPFDHLFVAWDGRCTCCCLDYECSMVVGDAKTQTITEIWNSDRYRRIREGFLNNEIIEPYCQICKGTISLIPFYKRRIRRGFSE